MLCKSSSTASAASNSSSAYGFIASLLIVLALAISHASSTLNPAFCSNVFFASNLPSMPLDVLNSTDITSLIFSRYLFGLVISPLQRSLFLRDIYKCFLKKSFFDTAFNNSSNFFCAPIGIFPFPVVYLSFLLSSGYCHTIADVLCLDSFLARFFASSSSSDARIQW